MAKETLEPGLKFYYIEKNELFCDCYNKKIFKYGNN